MLIVVNWNADKWWTYYILLHWIFTWHVKICDLLFFGIDFGSLSFVIWIYQLLFVIVSKLNQLLLLSFYLTSRTNLWAALNNILVHFYLLLAQLLYLEFFAFNLVRLSALFQNKFSILIIRIGTWINITASKLIFKDCSLTCFLIKWSLWLFDLSLILRVSKTLRVCSFLLIFRLFLRDY